MITERRQFSALVVSKSEKTADTLSAVLKTNAFSKVLRADSAGAARRMTLKQPVDVVVINTPLADDFGTQLAMDLSEKNMGVLVFVKKDVYDPVSYKLEEYGIVTLPKPVERTALNQSLKMLKAMGVKLAKLEAQKSSLESKMREIRLVNRAKWLLISHLSMSEEEAHRYIEKEAMDACVKKSEIAENIIKTYEV